MSFLKKLGKILAKPIQFSSNLARGVPLIGHTLAAPSQNLADALAGKQPFLAGIGKAGAGAAAIGLGGAGLLGAGPLAGLAPLGAKVGTFVTKNPLKAAQIGLGAVGAVQASQERARQRKLQEEALQQGAVFGGPTGAYSDTGNPFANAGLDPGNPYSQDPRYRRGQVALARELRR